MAPLISVVMPSLNQRPFIAEAVSSVLEQGQVGVELIVADGGSTDGTVEWLENRALAEPRLRWSSGPDTGPAQAINNAMRKARGTLLGWLNSDDCYTPGALYRAQQALQAHPDWLMVYGSGEHVDEHGVVLGDYPTLPPTSSLAEFSNGCFVCQPTVLMRRSFVLLNGSLDETLQTAFDFDWWLRAFRRFPDRIGFVDAVQARSRLHDACLTIRQRLMVAKEGMRVLQRHLGGAPSHWIKTWVNEARLSGQISGPDDLQVSDLIEEVDAWLVPSDREEIRRWLLQLRLSTGDDCHLNERTF